MAQSKRHSALEVCANTAIGFVGSWIITMACISEIKEPAVAATVSVVVCTVWSLLRGYTIRRHFNARQR